MAKYILLIFCGLVFFTGAGKAASREGYSIPLPASLQLQADTLTIEHDMALQPFLLDTITLEAIKRLLGDGWVIHRQAVANRFIKNQMDTIITFKKNKSYIRLYAVSKADKNFYQSAVISEPLPIFQKDMHVGQSKNEIRALFPELQHASGIPDNVRIAAGEAGDFLYLNFEKDILTKVVFKPYLD